VRSPFGQRWSGLTRFYLQVVARVPSRIVSVLYDRGVIGADLPQSLMVRLPSIDARGHQRGLASECRPSWYVTANTLHKLF
jgi:hypothetical protein